ncbi:MAG TPA: ABC transporter permease [Gemmatimonadaceae bacterium]|nr:ABC transporter permease [Gemmatimonadaceae bacterium]
MLAALARRPAPILIAGLLIALGLVLAAAGVDPWSAGAVLWRGAFGSWYALSATLIRATPLILTGLAVAVAFSAGVFNIGAEGQLLVGATAATWVALRLGPHTGFLTIPTVLLAGAAAGAGWAGIAAWLRLRFEVLEVISTLMLNFVAGFLVSYLVRGPLQEPLRIYPQSSSIPRGAQLPALVPGARLHIGFAIAVAACVAAWWVLRATAAGFRLRATGASPTAAWSAGLIPVGRTMATAFLVSGALAGLAGAIEVTGVTYALYEDLSPGYGFTAIAVALLAGLNPIAVVGSGILFGALEAGSGALQRDAGVPAVVVSVVEATLILVLVALNRVRLPSSGSGGGGSPGAVRASEAG